MIHEFFTIYFQSILIILKAINFVLKYEKTKGNEKKIPYL